MRKLTLSFALFGFLFFASFKRDEELSIRNMKMAVISVEDTKEDNLDGDIETAYITEVGKKYWIERFNFTKAGLIDTKPQPLTIHTQYSIA